MLTECSGLISACMLCSSLFLNQALTAGAKPVHLECQRRQIWGMTLGIPLKHYALMIALYVVALGFGPSWCISPKSFSTLPGYFSSTLPQPHSRTRPGVSRNATELGVNFIWLGPWGGPRLKRPPPLPPHGPNGCARVGNTGPPF